jgi:hypothetical protein
MPAERDPHQNKKPASILDIAGEYAEAGLSVIPIRANGSKKPDGRALPRNEKNEPIWSPFQREIAGPDERQRMFSNSCGIAIVGGRVSGNLEILDFDNEQFYERFMRLVKDAGKLDVIQRLPLIRTPAGWHIPYRCDVIEGSLKLAQYLDDQQQIQTAIETKGEGGYVLAVGCPPACHPLHKTYELMRGDLFNIPPITAEERQFLLSTARSLNGYHKQESKPLNEGKTAGEVEGGRPGDDFNQRATWAEIIEPHGWKRVSQKGDKDEWRRPGKDGKGISATTNYNGSGLFYVFSTNTQFEPERGYSRFSVYTILNYGSDSADSFQAAARELAGKGYGGEQKPQPDKTKNFPNLAGKVREYIESIEGSFSTYQLCADLGITDPTDKANIRKILNRLKGTQIQAHGNQAGCWRVIRGELERMDLQNVETEELDLWLPLDLHNYVRIMPGNEIIVTGDPDSGKTAFLLQTIQQNVEKWNCHYFNSEMGSYELRKRLELFHDFPIKHSHFHAYERSESFEDVVRPGRYNLNVIDYLEITDEFYLISKHLAEIYRSLKGSVALIAIQKRSRTSDLPLGAQRALEKPRLAISLSAGNRATPNKATILKCKNRKTDHSMVGRSRLFKLISGCEFRSDSPIWD